MNEFYVIEPLGLFKKKLILFIYLFELVQAA